MGSGGAESARRRGLRSSRPRVSGLVAATAVALAVSLAAAPVAAQTIDAGMPAEIERDAGAPPPPPAEPPEPEGDEGSADAGGPEAPEPRARAGPPADPAAEEIRIRYFLEKVEVRGNSRTAGYVVRRFVPLDDGDVLDVDDPALESVRWRLLGTGWFSDVRLRLRRGTQRGWVILVVEVEERNTFVITQLAFGITEGVRSSTDRSADLLPYGGLGVAETNLLGLGMELAANVAVSQRQQGVRLRYTDPLAFGSSILFTGSVFYNNAREFFGVDPLVAIRCPPPDPADPDAECPPEVEARNAVVFYRRYGLSLGMGHDLGPSSRYTLEWQGELVDVGLRPDAASERRGDEVRPVDFSIDNGTSFVSSLQLGVVFDRRDDPALTSRGTLVDARGDVGTRLIGSAYDFLRLRVLLRHWIPMPWASGHSLRLGFFGGVIFGRAPFFYKFYVSDLSDLIPSRLLEMNLDRRPPPDLFGTAIAFMRSEEIAGRADVEYGFPLYRGSGGFRAVNAYAGVGVYALADRRDLRVAVPGFVGLSRIPIDLTFDLGVRADTDVGVFQLGFSNLLGFITP